MNSCFWKRSILIVCLCVSLGACSIVTNEGEEKKKSSTHTKETTGEQQPIWSYTGDRGVDHWGVLDTTFSICGSGREQSPINLYEGEAKRASTAEIKLSYKTSRFSIRNNGYTIQAEAISPDNYIVIDGVKYFLKQFHFHLPSEHEISGKNLDMELHLVHQNAKEQLAVIGVLIKAGRENLALAELWEKLPRKETKRGILLKQPVELTSLLPQETKAFHYHGSLTTPPCTEGVKWAVIAEPIELSPEQIAAFSAIFPDNHRPGQPWNDRDVFEVLLGR